jgi:hypothetical protein
MKKEFEYYTMSVNSYVKFGNVNLTLEMCKYFQMKINTQSIMHFSILIHEWINT